jgi:acetoacetyl-CoA synthetase
MVLSDRGRISAATSGVLLSVHDVGKRFGGVIAADGISFDVAEGVAIGLIGPNGAGKSTLLKMIAAEQKPDRGEIWFAGARLDQMPQHRVALAGVALAHQIPKPFRRLSVRQNVQVGAFGGKRGRRSERDLVEQILATTGLLQKADNSAASLGLLDLKRLELARALSLAPKLLLLDEVGAGLALGELDAMMSLVGRIRDSGTTLLIVEHVEAVIRELASEVIVLDWGRIIKTGQPEAIAADADVRALYLGTKKEQAAQGASSRVLSRPSGKELLRLEAISVHYGGARALQDVNLSVRQGEVVAVFGANGAGKTTLANVISGLKRPSTGTIVYDGREISDEPAHKRVPLGIAHCHEGRRLFPEMTVRQNLDLGAYVRPLTAELAAQRELVYKLFPKLHERENQLAGTLSGGEQQMVAIGRALMSSPRLLLLDEASLGLAPIIADQILETVADIRNAGIAILLVEQNVHRSLAIADQVYVLDHGVITFFGKPDQLRGEETLWKVYFGNSTTVGSAPVQASAHCASSMPSEDSLEKSIVRVGDLLWTPSASWIANTNLTAFTAWLERERGKHFADYMNLWRWSVSDIEGFWQSIWDFFDIRASAPPTRILEGRSMPGAQWFPGAHLNYAEHVLRQARPGADAVLFLSETTPLTGVPWDGFASQIRTLATQLRALGINPGDRVVAYLPNIPQTMIAMLATAAIGAVWAVCSPDFGSDGALDRLKQLSPKLLFCCDGYQYGGKAFDRRNEVSNIIDHLKELEYVVYLSLLNLSDHPTFSNAISWSDLLSGRPVTAREFQFEQVPFEHPLWILFSSGTTGLPKAIVHSHGGILLEALKLTTLHMDVHPGERLFFFSTTGWMMWNFLASSLLSGACPVLYDGNPAYPDVDVLWKMAQDTGAQIFGTSPSYIDMMSKAGIVPKNKYDFLQLRAIMPAGSPVSAEHMAWFYRNIKRDLWVCPGSGGTDCCTGFVGGVPTQPVYAGEIQAPHLGVAAKAFDEQGGSLVDQVGELVITEPMPSMPVCFWNDPGNRRYIETYFADYPGIWRHGDFFRINARGGCFVLGRSDATLNRHGFRIGTAEIYRALATLEEIEDALIVNLDLRGGKFFMPLFVKLRNGRQLDADLTQRIANTLRNQYTPRHVPDKVIQAPDIPLTLTAKKMEVPIRKILMGVAPERAVNRSAMANPQALDFFVDYAKNQSDYALS